MSTEGFLSLLGTLATKFQIGLNGPMITSVSGKLRVRNALDNALANIEVDFPSDGDDAVPLDYLTSVLQSFALELRQITTSEGIQGGGDLSVDRNHKLDVNGLGALVGVDGSTDYFAVYDADAGVHRKVLVNTIIALAGGGAMDKFSMTCGRNANGINIWLRSANGVPLNQAPWRIAYTSTLVSISATTIGNETWDAEVYKNADVRAGGTPTDGNKIAELVLTAQNSGQITGLSAAVSAGDEIGVFCRGSAINRPHVTLWFEVV